MWMLLVDWEGQARDLVAPFRADAGERFGDPRCDRLTKELCARSPGLGTWWQAHHLADFGSTRWAFLHPTVGALTFDYVKLAALEAPGIKLFACLPARRADAGETARATGVLTGSARPCGSSAGATATALKNV